MSSSAGLKSVEGVGSERSHQSDRRSEGADAAVRSRGAQGRDVQGRGVRDATPSVQAFDQKLADARSASAPVSRSAPTHALSDSQNPAPSSARASQSLSDASSPAPAQLLAAAAPPVSVAASPQANAPLAMDQSAQDYQTHYEQPRAQTSALRRLLDQPKAQINAAQLRELALPLAAAYGAGESLIGDLHAESDLKIALKDTAMHLAASLDPNDQAAAAQITQDLNNPKRDDARDAYKAHTWERGFRLSAPIVEVSDALLSASQTIFKGAKATIPMAISGYVALLKTDYILATEPDIARQALQNGVKDTAQNFTQQSNALAATIEGTFGASPDQLMPTTHAAARALTFLNGAQMLIGNPVGEFTKSAQGKQTWGKAAGVTGANFVDITETLPALAAATTAAKSISAPQPSALAHQVDGALLTQTSAQTSAQHRPAMPNMANITSSIQQTIADVRQHLAQQGQTLIDGFIKKGDQITDDAFHAAAKLAQALGFNDWPKGGPFAGSNGGLTPAFAGASFSEPSPKTQTQPINQPLETQKMETNGNGEGTGGTGDKILSVEEEIMALERDLADIAYDFNHAAALVNQTRSPENINYFIHVCEQHFEKSKELLALYKQQIESPDLSENAKGNIQHEIDDINRKVLFAYGNYAPLKINALYKKGNDLGNDFELRYELLIIKHRNNTLNLSNEDRILLVTELNYTLEEYENFIMDTRKQLDDQIYSFMPDDNKAIARANIYGIQGEVTHIYQLLHELRLDLGDMDGPVTENR